MFLEPHFKNQRSGWIEVICGSMFSGKTEELIRRLKRAQIAHQNVVVYKPAKDTRYDDAKVVSHDASEIPSIPIHHPKEMLQVDDEVQVIGIDEAQFFDLELTGICEELCLRGKRVIVAGLDMDYTGKPFGPMPFLLSVAEYITKVHAICSKCNNLATHSYRKHNSADQVLLGEKDHYEARCRYCFNMGNMIEFPK